MDWLRNHITRKSEYIFARTSEMREYAPSEPSEVVLADARLCQNCQSRLLTFDRESVEWSTHHQSFTSLTEALEQKCEICTTLWEVLPTAHRDYLARALYEEAVRSCVIAYGVQDRCSILLSVRPTSQHLQEVWQRFLLENIAGTQRSTSFYY
jgi:hypothetical protein